jgi:hypothetical protein
MSAKRRRLKSGEEVIILYDVELGFIQQSVVFKEYREIDYHGLKHEIPIFERKDSEISGLKTFWIRPSDVIDDIEIEQIQRELIGLQLKALEIGHLKNYKVPEKISDKEIRQMADDRAKHREQLVKKLGYDPLDHSWVERELAENQLEEQWFKFQRENHGSFDDNWENTVDLFDQAYHKKITVAEAFSLSRKWKRYLMGAWNTIASQNANVEDWKTAAIKFETHHREVEDRMREWSISHAKNYPLAKVKEPVQFRHGPYFNECLERIPKLFTDATCYKIKKDVVLQVVAYDPKLKYIRLDFTRDIREKIKPGIPPNDPWLPLRADYVIYVPPADVETHLEFLGSLD